MLLYCTYDHTQKVKDKEKSHVIAGNMLICIETVLVTKKRAA